MMILEDGKGTGLKAGVTTRNELLVRGSNSDEMSRISESDEQAFIISSGDFTAITTTGVEHAVLHFKNTSSTKNFYVTSIRSCGTMVQKWKLYRNSTGGTLITEATIGPANNINIGSATQPECEAFKALEGRTITGGVMIEHWINEVGHSLNTYSGALIIQPGSSIQLTLEAGSAGDICARILGYYKLENT